MLHPKSGSATRRIVWRMSAAAPQGEYEYHDGTPERDDPPPTDTVHEYGWLASSLELLGGVRVSETPMDTLPGELIDAFLKR
jgi:hypothetical protein